MVLICKKNNIKKSAQNTILERDKRGFSCYCDGID